MDTNTENRVRQVIADQLGINPEEVQDDARLAEDLGADSLDLTMLGTELEISFNIDIPDEDIEPLQTVGEIINYLERRLF